MRREALPPATPFPQPQPGVPPPPLPGRPATRPLSWLTYAEENPVPGAATRRWEVRARDGRELVGWVRWLPRWRRYVFWPAAGSLFDAACLRDVAAFVEERTREHVAARRAAFGGGR